MARGKRIIGIDAVNQQIETAEAEVIKAKKKYDEATDKLKEIESTVSAANVEHRFWVCCLYAEALFYETVQ